jgi:hypothetical protein
VPRGARVGTSACAAYSELERRYTRGKINAWRDYFDMNQFTSRMG